MLERLVLEAVEVLAALAVYFLPALIADRRKRHDLLTIALFNACLGWTVFGWLIAIYWAYLPNPPTGLAGEVVRKRRILRMRAFSEALAARISKRMDRR